MKIFFRTLDNEITSDIRKYPNTSSYLAALGGAISVYLGASLLNVFEAFEFVFRLSITGVLNLLNRPKENQIF